MADYNYDEQGQFFPFFVIAILLLILLPATYRSFAGKRPSIDTSPRIECDCAACEKKKALLATKRKHIYRPEVLRNYVLLAIGWGIVAYMAYTIATTKIVNTVWDPYAVLGISTSTPLDKIKSHYKKLSRTLHPDKVKLVGNLTKEVVERRFVDITKAYKALTDDEIRRNYEEYGHPDGKQEFSVGIALPKWIVESSNGYYVLGFYGLLFGILLPAFVGRWWYGSRNLTKEGIETETAARYFKAVKENTSEDDVLDIVASSHEFEVFFNTNHRADTIDTVKLEKKLAQANGPIERLSSQPHLNSIIKPSEAADISRMLLYSHLHRASLDPTIEVEKHQIVDDAFKFVPAFVQIGLAFNYFEPVRAAMEISQHIAQALPLGSSPLLQLPGVDSQTTNALNLREKEPVRTLQELLRLDEKERRKVLAKLDDKAYSQAISIAKQIPILIVTDVHFKVTGDKIITPGAIVQLVFTTRLATDKDYRSDGVKPTSDTNDSLSSGSESDNEEEDVDILIGRKKRQNDGTPTPLPLAHAPYFPSDHKPTWWAFLADPRGNRVIVHPTVITDIGTSPRKWRIQFQAPPQVASYLFQLHVKSDSYFGTDVVQEVTLNVHDAKHLEETVVEEIIPENDEESEKEEDESDEDDEDDSDEDTDTDTDTDTDSD